MESHEQKYKEALELARDYYKANLTLNKADENAVLEDIFPELKESEDEKIRKAILTGLIDCRDAPDLGWSNFGGISIDDCISWLEKQEGCEHIKQSWYNEGFIDGKYSGVKEWTSNDDATLKELIDFLENKTAKLQHDLTRYANWLKIKLTPIEKQGKSALEAIKEEKVDNANKYVSDFKASDYYVSKVDGKIHSIHNFNEQKFKVGDWIVDKSGFVQQVLDFRGGIYTCTYHSFTTDCGSNYHLWTIEDAKDGDILVSNYGWPFIYNGNHNSMHVGAYCGISTENRFNVATEKCRWTANVNIRPATKDQRDILMNAMNDDGYEFDFDKKELKKIICLSAKHNSQLIMPTDE